jgi:hypothetical protein
MSEQDPDKMTSEEIFFQYCIAKPKKAMEFLDDYIIYLLKIENPFETEKYLKLQNFILDFMVGGDYLFDIFLKFFSCGKKNNYSKDEFNNLYKNEIDTQMIDFCYNFFISNLNNIQFLRSKKLNEVNEEEMKNYKTNLQMNFGHSSIANEEPDFNVLLKVNKNKNNSKEGNILEIGDKELDSLINKLKDIYGQIKS